MGERHRLKEARVGFSRCGAIYLASAICRHREPNSDGGSGQAAQMDRELGYGALLISLGLVEI